MPGHLLFVCVANRVRSPFAEFFLRDIWREKGEDLTVSSAGYVPQALKDRLAGHNIPFPDPFFNRPMSELARTALYEKGIHVSNGWRSKELNPGTVEEVDLIITALTSQKEGLSRDYYEFRNKVLTINELSEKKDHLFLEDYSGLPLDDNFWHYCEEDPEYVSKTLRTWEEILLGALPNITVKLRSGSEESVKA